MNPEQRKQIEQLYLEMYDMLLAYASCALKEQPLAEEVVQETFQIACQKPEQLCESLNPKGWLVNTLKNTIRNKRRSIESAQRLVAEYLATQGKSITFREDKLSLEVIYEDVANMEEFRLIREMAIDGKSYLEMAKARGITVNACKKRVQRAKIFLKNNL